MASNKRVATGFPGVYFREGAGRKRTREDGGKDRCFSTRYHIDGQWYYETIGWESEGATLEKAVSLRRRRLETPSSIPEKKNRIAGNI